MGEVAEEERRSKEASQVWMDHWCLGKCGVCVCVSVCVCVATAWVEA